MCCGNAPGIYLKKPSPLLKTVKTQKTGKTGEPENTVAILSSRLRRVLFRNLYTRAHLESSRSRPQLRPQERIEAAREELAAQALEIGPRPLLAPGLPDEWYDRLFHRFQDCMCVCVCVCVRAQLRTAALFSSPSDEVIN